MNINIVNIHSIIAYLKIASNPRNVIARNPKIGINKLYFGFNNIVKLKNPI